MAFSFGNIGQSQQQQSQPASTTPSFSFGNPAASSTTAAIGSTSTPSFSFGGSSQPAASSSQPGSSLFGQPQQQQAGGQQQQQQPGGSGLFGGFGGNTGTNASSTTQQPSATGGGFSFGGFGAKPAGTTSTPGSTGGGLFGGLGSSQQQNSQLGQQQQQPKPAFSFGGSTSNNAAPGGLSFGASTSQAQPQAGGQAGSTSTAPITKSTRFEDLPEPARRTIEEIETYIQGRIAIYDQLKAEKLGKEIEETSLTLREISTEFAALSNHLAHDSRHTTDLRNRFEQSLKDAVKAAQIVDAFRTPPPNQPGSVASQAPKPHPTFLQDFFRRKTEELAQRLATYKTSIEQIQALLSRSDPDQVKAILPTLRAQHTATLQLASRMSTLEGSVTELKDEYRDLWRERTGSVRDPFVERRREVLGAEAAGVVDGVSTLAIR